jgi:hypothetical protein
MRSNYHGKYTFMRKNSPRGIGTCDYSGLMVQHLKMRPQYQYRGQGLVNTGYMVYTKFLDNPNPQDLTPLIRPDPVPLVQPRPDSTVDVIPQTTITVDVSGSGAIFPTELQDSYTNLVFTGELTGDRIVMVMPLANPGAPNLFVPGIYEFFAFNETTGGFNCYAQIPDNSASRVLLIPNTQMLLCNDGYTIRIINPN